MATANQAIRVARPGRQRDDGVGVAPQGERRDGARIDARVEKRNMAGAGSRCQQPQLREGAEAEQRLRRGARVDTGAGRQVPRAQGVVPRGRVRNGRVGGREDGGGDGGGVAGEDLEGSALGGGLAGGLFGFFGCEFAALVGMCRGTGEEIGGGSGGVGGSCAPEADSVVGGSGEDAGRRSVDSDAINTCLMAVELQRCGYGGGRIEGVGLALIVGPNAERSVCACGDDACGGKKLCRCSVESMPAHCRRSGYDF